MERGWIVIVKNKNNISFSFKIHFKDLTKFFYISFKYIYFLTNYIILAIGGIFFKLYKDITKAQLIKNLNKYLSYLEATIIFVSNVWSPISNHIQSWSTLFKVKK